VRGLSWGVCSIRAYRGILSTCVASPRLNLAKTLPKIVPRHPDLRFTG
jgi:hypothetical protein